MNRGIVLVLLAAALAGCGDQDSGAEPGPPAASPTAMLPADGPVRAMGTVVDEGDGPVLCLGDMAFTAPPQCEGVPVAGWDWQDHPDAERLGGAHWGRYELEGGWDGTTLTPTRADVAELEVSAGPIGDYPFTTRCEEPDGGWQVVDPATTTQDAKGRAGRVAEGLPDYGLIWGDQSINPVWPETEQEDPPSLEVQQAMNDPAYTVLNVGVTEDLERAETAVREVWGGPLCVYRVDNTFARLREVAGELQDLPGGRGAQFGEVGNRVQLLVVHDDGSIQAWADETYGEGVVEVTSALEPVE